MDGRELVVADDVTSLVVDYPVSGVRAQYRRHLMTVAKQSEPSSAVFVLDSISRNNDREAPRLASDQHNEHLE